MLEWLSPIKLLLLAWLFALSCGGPSESEIRAKEELAAAERELVHLRAQLAETKSRLAVRDQEFTELLDSLRHYPFHGIERVEFTEVRLPTGTYRLWLGSSIGELRQADWDVVVESMTEIEGKIGEPFPTPDFRAAVRPEALSSYHAGRYGRGGYIVVDSLDPMLLQHEFAHHYFHGNERWVDEGMATVFSGDTCRFCERYGPYRLGLDRFNGLRLELGEDAFLEGARRLYAYSRESRAGLEEVRRAFPSAQAQAKIDSW